MTPVWLILGAAWIAAHLLVLVLAKAARMGDDALEPDWDAAFARYLQELER